MDAEGAQGTNPQQHSRHEPGNSGDAGQQGEDQAVDHGIEPESPELRAAAKPDGRQDDEANNDLGPARTRDLVGSNRGRGGGFPDSCGWLGET